MCGMNVWTEVVTRRLGQIGWDVNLGSEEKTMFNQNPNYNVLLKPFEDPTVSTGLLLSLQQC